MSSFENYGQEILFTKAVQKELDRAIYRHHNFEEQYQSSVKQLSHMFGKTLCFEGEPYLITGLKYDFKQEVCNPRSELRGKRMVHFSTVETYGVLMFELKQSFTETVYMDAKYVLDHYNKIQGNLEKGGKQNETD